MSSGGLGDEVSIALRAAALPGTEHLMALVANRCVVAVVRGIGRSAAAAGVHITADPSLTESVRAITSLADRDLRRSFVQTLRAVVDRHGQRVSAHDLLDRIMGIPSLLIWGADDRIIPVEHAHRAHRAMPASRLSVFARAGHFPHLTNPHRFVHEIHALLNEEPHVGLPRPIADPVACNAMHTPRHMNS